MSQYPEPAKPVMLTMEQQIDRVKNNIRGLVSEADMEEILVLVHIGAEVTVEYPDKGSAPRVVVSFRRIY